MKNDDVDIRQLEREIILGLDDEDYGIYEYF